MLKIRAQLTAIFLLDPERGQDGGDGANNHRVDIAVMDSLLLGERLHHDSPDIIAVYFIHRRMSPRMSLVKPESTLDDPDVIV
jgi:hypothetical protein